jgi:hypothetical protein
MIGHKISTFFKWRFNETIFAVNQNCILIGTVLKVKLGKTFKSSSIQMLDSRDKSNMTFTF